MSATRIKKKPYLKCKEQMKKSLISISDLHHLRSAYIFRQLLCTQLKMHEQTIKHQKTKSKSSINIEL